LENGTQGSLITAQPTQQVTRNRAEPLGISKGSKTNWFIRSHMFPWFVGQLDILVTRKKKERTHRGEMNGNSLSLQ